jgi:hypothetical protein
MCTHKLFFSGILMLFVLFRAAAAEPIVLVEQGEGKAVIPEEPSSLIAKAAEELQHHIERASGAELPVVSASSPERQADVSARILVGFGRGIDTNSLKPEEYVIKTVGNALSIVGEQQSSEPRATLYGVYDFLDRELGVRWLWPGEVGTYVPKRDTIALETLDIRTRPPLEKRNLRFHVQRSHSMEGVPRLLDDETFRALDAEARQWLDRHMMGGRSSFGFGHAFGKWWDRYHEEHPDYFAVPPEGVKQPSPSAERVKLCVSNPAVADQIVEEWRAAGRPDNWNVCPNDSRGFCTCDKCRALDGFPNQSPEMVWNSSSAILTGRYLDLWNRLLPRMRAENPNVTLSSYAYSNYREPLEGMRVEEGLVLGFVDTYHAYDQWRAWHDAGAKLFLRPNWWHTGAVAPINPLHAMGDYFKFAYENSMLGFDFDSLMGYWGTQGPCYYLIARLSVRPDLTVDQVIDEYCAAFGGAKGQIKRYIRYWEDYTAKCVSSPSSGGAAGQEEKSLFEKAREEHDLGTFGSRAWWRSLPFLYSDDIMTPAFQILDEAERSAENSDAVVKQRIQFLRDGLVHLERTRDVILVAYDETRPSTVSKKDAAKRIMELQKLRAELTPRHVVWGEVANWMEARRGIKSAAGRKEWTQLEGE